VILRRRQQARIIALTPVGHEVGNELLSRQTAKGLIFGRDDYIEATRGGCDHPVPGQPPDSHFGRRCRAAQRLAAVGRGKVVATAGGKAVDEAADRWMAGFLFHSYKVTNFVTLCKFDKFLLLLMRNI
jgi:hypothetical protein